MNTVAKHLMNHGYITNLIYFGTYGKHNGLAQRIHDLRGRGWKIATIEDSDDRGKPFARYVLVATPEEAQLRGAA